MRESLSRLLDALRAQKALYAEMLSRVEEQDRIATANPELLMATLAEQKMLKTQIDTIQKEAAAHRAVIDADPVPMSGEERALVDAEVSGIQETLKQLIQVQGTGMEKWQAEKDAVVQRIRQISQGKRALDAYGGRAPRRPHVAGETP